MGGYPRKTHWLPKFTSGWLYIQSNQGSAMWNTEKFLWSRELQGALNLSLIQSSFGSTAVSLSFWPTSAVTFGQEVPQLSVSTGARVILSTGVNVPWSDQPHTLQTLANPRPHGRCLQNRNLTCRWGLAFGQYSMLKGFIEGGSCRWAQRLEACTEHITEFYQCPGDNYPPSLINSQPWLTVFFMHTTHSNKYLMHLSMKIQFIQLVQVSWYLLVGRYN